MLVRYNEQSFDWLTWRNGTLLSLLKIDNRTDIIKANRDILRKFAIGWCQSDNIPCRSKGGYYAVMFLVDGQEFWTHLNEEEFKYCFETGDKI